MTRSTFAGFTTAHLAMAASQRSIDITGQNIANINTKGYTKQRVDLVSFNTKGGDPVGTAPSSKIGYGVEITGISQIRDPFLDVQFRNQIAKVGTADSRQAALDQLANIFDETDKEALKQALSDLSSSLDKLSSNANSREFDSIVRSRFQVVVDYIHQKSADLQTVREETINGLESTDIPVVNNLLSDIGKLNDAIWKSQVQGNPSLELLDERNNKFDELASYLPISVTYKDVVISTGTKFEYPEVKFRGSNGAVYNLTGGEHGENYASISMERKPEGKVSILLIPASDFPMGSDLSALKTDITDNLKEGSLKGTVDSLNKSGELDSPSSDFRGIGYYEKAFESFVQEFAKTFNDLNAGQYPGGMRPYTGALLHNTLAVSKDSDNYVTFGMNFTNATGNFLKGETVTINGQTFKFTDSPSPAAGEISLGTDLNASLKNLADAMNAAPDPDAKNLNIAGNPEAGTWDYSNGRLIWKSDAPITGTVTDPKTDIKTAGDQVISLDYEANPDNKRSFNLFRTADGETTFTASNIKISDDWMNNTIYIISSTKEGTGTTANDNILKMLKALTDERDFKYNHDDGSIPYYRGNFFQCYSNLENTQGIDSSSNGAVLTNHMSVLAQTADSKDSVSGVSLDEEGISLMQYQRSFSAAARLMTTLDEALNILINSTGIVGR